MERLRYQKPAIRQRKNGVFYIRPRIDVISPDGGTCRDKKVIVLVGAKTKNDANRMAKDVMEKINSPRVVQLAKITFGALLDVYEDKHINTQLKATTQAKYRGHIKRHIRPFFGEMALHEIKTLTIQNWIDSKAEAGLSWNTRYDLRNVLSGIFERAIAWEYWPHTRNPVDGVKCGKKKLVREKRKLTEDQTIALLGLLREDVRQLCKVGLFCGLRISELLALKEKHLDFDKGLILVRERYWRGNTDDTKTDKSTRDVPMGRHLKPILKQLCTGDPEHYIFNITTRPHWGEGEPRICRDDTSLRRYFLQPVAKKLGIYYKGFGFHSLRREAVTEMIKTAGVGAAMSMAGHSSVEMSLLYNVQDNTALNASISAFQERIVGTHHTTVQ